MIKTLKSSEDDAFRGLDHGFKKSLKSKRNKLNFILDYEGKHRGKLIVEIRRKYVELYYLGHGIEVKRLPEDEKYYLIWSKQFDKELSYTPDESKAGNKSYSPTKWRICFNDINNKTHFNKIMKYIISTIVIHKEGTITEGVSEMNHLADNREIGPNGILIIDRQVVYPGTGKRIDLLGVKRQNKTDKYVFVVIELKNKNNGEIRNVFSQLREYIEIVHKNYEHFVRTYKKVIDQKRYLGLLTIKQIEFAARSETTIDIHGIAILDNFNIRSDLKRGGLLEQALEDWMKDNTEYCLSLFLKSNVLDSTFFIDYPEAFAQLNRYKVGNKKAPIPLPSNLKTRVSLIFSLERARLSLVWAFGVIQISRVSPSPRGTPATPCGHGVDKIPENSSV